jgi:hypothetical protein
VESPPAIPFTSQFTFVLELPETIAVKLRVWPVCTVAPVGEIHTCNLPFVTMTRADVDFVLSAREVAVIVIAAGLGTLAGALYVTAEDD